MKTNLDRVYKMLFADIYPLYLTKVTRKGRTRTELDEVLRWLTGYTQMGIEEHTKNTTTLEAFFDQAPHLNPNVTKITGVICGYRIEEIEDPLMRKIRYMDKLVDELAKGRSMDKILRS